MNSFFDVEYLQMYINERAAKLIADLDLGICSLVKSLIVDVCARYFIATCRLEAGSRAGQA
jgi:hypothetical protein